MIRSTFPSLALQRDSAARASGANGFVAELHAEAMRIGADIRAGRRIITEHGIFTPADLAHAVEIEGGVYYPTRSCGVVL